MTKSIAVAGKGGTGKSTVAALLVETLIRKGLGPVLAVDADPDSNLGTLLGMRSAQTVGGLRDEILQEIKNFPPGMTKANYIEAGLHGVIEEGTGFDLVTMGKGEGSGCYCFINSLIRKFCDDLAPSYRWMVMDNEAGLEHLSRRTTVDVDGLVVVVTENPLSLHSARKVEEITDGFKDRIRERFVVTNMVREDRREIVHSRLAGLSMELLCDIPHDPRLEELVFAGEPLRGVNGAIAGCIEGVIERIGGNRGAA
jgi:CO dehydrogenase maturation factor